MNPSDLTAHPHCLLVGFGPGLALAIAQRFAKEGFAIGAVSRDATTLGNLAGQIAPHAPYASAAADATNFPALREAIATCERINGSAGVLVFNVGVPAAGALSELEADTFRRSLEANVTAALIAVQCVLPGMRQAGAGTLLFTGGGLALRTAPGMGALSVGKAALRNLALTFAAELKPVNVHAATVTIRGTIEPGTFYAPERIAEVYWQLHTESPGHWREEVIYQEHPDSP